ncbi:ABC-F family ATP-binding cassette domain-containing protein [Massilimicrobiota timonensis]|uniref:ABC-F family ATP-binding cassette domain-containing protein n=1 Tax=Massilimicrobiota timonensis TaxID=1776392 RepID=A0ABT7UJZ2_9FIRM|nr:MULTISPECIES: ABC-F family ATP-binding cassette domain-containing protein [Massilimicrobiota]MDM8196450.1 ABC-F family ATP-binding cassette domain-containing protein [Massilimicrobiota timonensis]NJE44210.1 ABC transporter ATP-binding protein [Massilimicrobiota sp. SW1139]OUQ76833.1 ABC transporter [Massilimicrobiota sp. An105]
MLMSVSHLSKYNNLKCIAKDISFSIHERDKIGLIGLNGTGKSTLLKILAGQEDYKGEIIKKKDIRINYLPQIPSFQPQNTVLEQVYEDVGHDVAEYEIKSILNRFQIINHSQPISQLSGGQKKRVALAIALIKPCDLLLLDEPTNHLDHEMIEYLEKYLTKFNRALVMITHDRYFLERITHRMLELEHGQLYTYEANYSLYLEQKAKREESLQNAQHKRKQFLKKELEWVRAGVQARTTKNKGRLQRYEALSQQADLPVTQNLEMIDTASRLGQKTIELHGISHRFDHLLFQPFDYLFQRNERVGIVGINGSGKSTLLHIIAGQIQPTSGEVEYGETIRIGYFKQGHEDMDDNQRVIDYIQEEARYLKTRQGEFSAKQMCEKFLFDKELQYTPIGRLSGGEKRRLYLLKVLMGAPNVLLLDEPTNDLDITTLQILEDYLDSFQGIIITVSHDRYFLDRLCDTLFVFSHQQIQVHNGGYSDYIITSNQTSSNKPKSSTKKPMRERKVRLTYLEKKELESLEADIPALEQKLQQLDEQLNQVTDFHDIQELSNQRNALENEIETKSIRWLELLEKEEQ